MVLYVTREFCVKSYDKDQFVMEVDGYQCYTFIALCYYSVQQLVYNFMQINYFGAWEIIIILRMSEDEVRMQSRVNIVS